MTNQELVAELSELLAWSELKVSEVLAHTVDQLNSKLAGNATISITDFGVFQTQKKEEYISVDPQTQQRLLVPPEIFVNFKSALVFKEKSK